jgi:predicted DNA binding CopG/RHH family protein
MVLEVAGFDWDDANRDKCVKHDVTIEEIERLLHEKEVYIVPALNTPKLRRAIPRLGHRRAVAPCSLFSPSASGTGAGCYARSRRDTYTPVRPADMSKSVPHFASDEEAEAFLEQDLTDYLDLGAFRPVRFVFSGATRRVSLQIPEALLQAVKSRARRDGMSYQDQFRRAFERSLADEGPVPSG